MLKHNPRWAAKLEKQRERREAHEKKLAARHAREHAAETTRKQQALASNPFAPTGDTPLPSLFSGSSLFSTSAPEAPPTSQDTHADAADETEDDEFDEDERLAEELAIKASLEEQRAALGEENDWARTAPCYTPALYLNTIPEPLRESPAAPEPLDSTLEHAAETGADMDEADEEEYENHNPEGMDSVFERFTERLGTEARQVVRYAFDGKPLPFTSAGALYRQLWPNGTLDTSHVPACPECHAPRVFEAQLMPNLANLLRAEHLEGVAQDAGAGDAEARRRAAIATTLGIAMDKDDAASSLVFPTGIVWSTAMVFVCSKDCCPSTNQGWREEWIGVQLESEL